MSVPWGRTALGWRRFLLPRLDLPRRGQRLKGCALHYLLGGLAFCLAPGRVGGYGRKGPPLRVLFVGRTHLGDFLMAVPAMRLLKESVPDSRISATLQRRYRDFLGLEGTVDAAIEEPDEAAPFRERLRAWRTVLQDGGYDTVVFPRITRADLPALLAAFLHGVPNRVGAGDRGVQALLTHASFPKRTEKIPEAARRLVATFLGVPAAGGLAWPSLRRTTPATTYDLLFAPFAQHTKTWDVASWRRLFAWTREKGLTAAMVGSASQREEGARLLAGEPGIVDRIGTTDLPELLGLVAAARAVVGIDTGVRHLAAALGAPCVVLGNGREDSAAIGPYVSTERYLVQAVPCAPCGAEPCPLVHLACVRGISPEAAIRALEEVLAADTRPTAG